MKIATWNINSVRLRMPLLKKLMVEERPDIICLQETKVEDFKFPANDIKEMGYENIVFRGEKSYNGVAILSKKPFTAVKSLNWVNKEDARHIKVMLPGDVELHNFYVPAGGDEPDIKINDKYKHKLDFVDHMNSWFLENRKPDNKMIILGDFNIAPHENDVWSHKQLVNVISHTEPEITRLIKLQKELNWIDTGRYFTPMNEKLYSWWSYRNKDWKKSNRGRRLDHIWVTSSLEKNIISHNVLIKAREWQQPSDHVPVILEINL